jgi:amino acid adenylation domain-containing protein
MATRGKSDTRPEMLRDLRDLEGSLPAAFERIAAVHGVRTALLSDRWQLAYAELNVSANRLAHAIVARGGALGDRVAILMEHDAPAIAAMVATLKAGRISVALSAMHPEARLRELLEDAEPTCIVTDNENSETAAKLAGSPDRIIHFKEASGAGPDHNPTISVDASQAAIIVYTSGSTGRPKGVMKTHRQMLADGAMYGAELALRGGDKIPLFGSLSHGQAICVTWLALLNGVTLCPCALVLKGAPGLTEWMTARGINIYVSSASIFRSFMRTLAENFLFPQVRIVWLASEPATSEDFRSYTKHFPQGSVFIHTYSSSETSNIGLSRLAPGDQVPEGRLPLAAASKGQTLFLLDDRGRPVAPGEAGEIVVKSRTLAAGYWRNPTLTAERFPAASDGSGLRLFRTGDLARIGSDGLLEFVGRTGTRVKVRGNTIDLSEVESALQALSTVEQAFVDTIERERREDELVAYVVARAGQATSSAELRRALRGALPDHMVPSRVVLLDRFPYLLTGKVDRKKLQEFLPQDRAEHDQRPKTETEKLLADFWAKEFELIDIRRDDNFFDLGGDSLMASVIAARVLAAMEVSLTLEAFFNHPTLHRLARFIDGRGRSRTNSTPPMLPAPRDQPLPLSFWEERTWNYSQTPEDSAGYTAARPYRLLGPLDVEILRACMSYLERRHEILRTTYPATSRGPVRLVHPPEPVSFEVIDLTSAADPESAARNHCESAGAISFDLARGPLVKFVLIRLREREHWLLRLAHHINCDSTSWDLYFWELALLYESKLRGDDPPLPALAPLQYSDYAVWQRQLRHHARSAIARSLEWWQTRLAASPPPLELPFQRPKRQVGIDPEQGRILWGVEPQISRRLDNLGHAADASPYMVRLAAFAAMVAIETGHHDVVLGSYASERNRIELQDMFGLFTNLVTLRFQFDLKISFLQWLSIIRKRVLEVQSQSTIPYTELCKELSQKGIHPPQLRALFQMSRHRIDFRFANIELSALPRCESFMPWGFTLAHDGNDEERACRAVFDARIYDPAGVSAFLGRYKRFLETVSHHPEGSMANLSASGFFRNTT